MKATTKIKILKEQIEKHTHIECVCDYYWREIQSLEHDIAVENGLEPELLGKNGGPTEPF